MQVKLFFFFTCHGRKNKIKTIYYLVIMDQQDFFGNSFVGGKFGSERLGIFLFCFCLVRGMKVASAQDFGWRSKGEDHFKLWFPFFSCLLVTILYCSDIVWSKDLSVYFFCFLPIFDRKFFLLFCFLPIFEQEFSFVAFFRSYCLMYGLRVISSAHCRF